MGKAFLFPHDSKVRYEDIDGTPTIPTTMGELEDDVGYAKDADFRVITEAEIDKIVSA